MGLKIIWWNLQILIIDLLYRFQDSNVLHLKFARVFVGQDFLNYKVQYSSS